MQELIIVFIAFLIAGWVQGLIGFGFAVVTTLLLVNRVDFITLVYFNLCMSVLTSIIAMFNAKNLKSIHKPTLLKLILSACAGLFIGLALINVVNSIVLKKITLSVILMASIVSLTKNKVFFSHKYISWVAGFFSGVLTPSTGINGPLVALHLNAVFTNKEQIRNTMLSYLFLIMTFGVVTMSLQMKFTPDILQMLWKLVIPSLAGYVLGMFSFRLLPDLTFQKTVIIFLILSSISSLIYLIV
jgi:uncharacterized membrane protein YfcA